jgi:hypothetical protein
MLMSSSRGKAEERQRKGRGKAEERTELEQVDDVDKEKRIY